MERTYIYIGLKFCYASVECIHRGLEPLEAKLLAADEARSDQTICLAVSTALKAIGVPGRSQLFMVKRVIRKHEAHQHAKVWYITAVPRMEEYERIAVLVCGICLQCTIFLPDWKGA